MACGYDFTADELLFLSKTFETVASGDLEMEIEDRYNPLPVLSEFEQELYKDLFFSVRKRYTIYVHDFFNCNVWFQKISIPLVEGFFQFDPQPPRFSVPGDFTLLPPTPGISMSFPLGPPTSRKFQIHKYKDFINLF